jgi:hypothetical protein
MRIGSIFLMGVCTFLFLSPSLRAEGVDTSYELLTGEPAVPNAQLPYAVMLTYNNAQCSGTFYAMALPYCLNGTTVSGYEGPENIQCQLEVASAQIDCNRACETESGSFCNPKSGSISIPRVGNFQFAGCVCGVESSIGSVLGFSAETWLKK